MSWDAQKEHPIDGVQTRGTNIAIVSAHNIKAVEKYFPTHRYIISESAWNSAKSDLADKTRRARDGVVKVYGTTKKILKWLQE